MVSKRFASLNYSINITTVCHEARAVVMETYDQFPNIVWEFSTIDPTDHELDAFMYVDNKIDTVYVEDHDGVHPLIAPYLGKVQHLTYEVDLPRAFTELAMLKRDCPMLKSFTFIAPRDNSGDKHDEEWRLVDVPTDFDPAMTLPQLTPNGSYNEEQLEKFIDDHGDLALLGAEAKETLMYFEKHVRDQAEWKDSLKIAILASRRRGSLSWTLNYLVHPSEECSHLHEEPVLLRDGAVTLYRPDPHPNRLCEYCGRQRWLLFNDAFWLFKDEGEEDTRRGKPHDPSAGSAEDARDEEPENEVEEVTEYASEDSDDNIKIFTGEESDEFAEGY